MNLKDYLTYLIPFRKITINLFVFLIISYSTVFSQNILEPTQEQNVQIDTTKFVMTKSPWGAVVRSAVIPGWGQFYNESYWKVPVIASLTGYFIYGWIHYNNLYDDNKTLYTNAISNNSSLANFYKRKRDFYRDERDMFAFYMGLTYFLNMVDAYVDAQMFDFSVSEDPITLSPQLNIKVSF